MSLYFVGTLAFIGVSEVSASESGDLSRRWHYNCGGNSSHPGCPGSSLNSRVKTGLTIGAVCLVLLIGVVLGVVCYIYRRFKPDPTGQVSGTVDSKRTKVKKKRKTKRQTPSVFTVTNEESMRSDYNYSSQQDRLQLVVPALPTPREARRQIEDSFNEYTRNSPRTTTTQSNS